MAGARPDRSEALKLWIKKNTLSPLITAGFLAGKPLSRGETLITNFKKAQPL